MADALVSSVADVVDKTDAVSVFAAEVALVVFPLFGRL